MTLGLTLRTYIDQVQAGKIDPSIVVQEYLGKAHADPYHAYLKVTDSYAKMHVEEFSHRSLCAAPIAIKDMILTEGEVTTCGSKILEDFVAPYSATCFTRLEEAGGLMIGKANMDEFGMGSSNENSAFGPVKNPLDPTRIPGGSSGGSAAAVAGDLCIAALGTDTGGSVRTPAAFCGIVGVKPTYGRISRYGVQPLASSLDQIGVLTKTVEDSVLLLSAMSGYDQHDATSVAREDLADRTAALQQKDLQGVKIAVPNEFFGEGLDSGVREVCLHALEQIKSLGATVDRVDIPSLQYGVPTYYIILPAEASTNLAKFDGIRFGYQEDTKIYDTLPDYYEQIRQAGFGDEVKRRILIGTYVLSAGFYDEYYRRAQQVRQKIRQDLSTIYRQYDAIIGPTVPTPAWKLGAKITNPIAMYLADIYTVIANLAGLPAMSLPAGYVYEDEAKLPVGLQIICEQRQESKMFHVASCLEKTLQNDTALS